MEISIFENEINTLKQNFDNIKLKMQEIQNIQNKIEKIKQNYKLKQSIEQSLDKLEQLYIKTNKSSSTLENNEYTHRINQIQKLKSYYNDLNFEILNMENNVTENDNNNNISEIEVKDEITNKTGSQILQMTKEKMSKQDEMLDELHNLLTVTTKFNKDIHSEIQNQKPLLSNLEKNMDTTSTKMKNTTKNVEKVNNNTSFCFYYIIIWIEIILMIVLLLG